MSTGKRKSFSVFYKYLTSYTVVLVIPLLILGISGYSQLKETINKQVGVNQQKLLDELREDMDQKWIQMNQIAGRIAVHPKLTPYSISEYFASAYPSNPFMDYLISNSYLHEIIYYIRGETYLYSSASTYPLSMFMKDIYQYPGWNERKFMQALDHSRKPLLRAAEEVIMPNGAKERLISYMVPIPLGSSDPYGTVMFLIKENSFLEFSRYLNEYEQGNLLIFGPEEQLIATHDGSAHKVVDVEKNRYVHEDDQAFEIRVVEGISYYISHTGSPITGWTYVLLTPVKEVMKPIEEAVHRWNSTLAVILFIGGFLIFAALYYNYYPIKKLVKLAEKHWGKSEGSTNEIERVGTMIHRAVESNLALDRRVAESRYAIREHMLSELLKGEIDSLEDWNRQADMYGVEIEEEQVCVVVLEGDDLNSRMRNMLAAEAERRKLEHMKIFSKDTLEKHRIILIATGGFKKEELRQWLTELQQYVTEEWSLPVVFGAGTIYDRLKHAGRSWIEASTAADYKLIKGANQIIFFEELGLGEATALPYPRLELEWLSVQIKRGNTVRVKEAIQAVTEQIKQSSPTLVQVRCLCYDIIITVMNTVHELKMEHAELKVKFPDVWTLMDFDTVEELAVLITDACVKLSEAVSHTLPESKDSMVEEMLKYIHTNCVSYHFSIQQMADDFSVSTSYLSRYFKEKTGGTLSEYVNLHRIEEAKQMLASDNRPVKDIIQSVGYSDPSSFTRKFKNIVGMTPIEYRRRMNGTE